MNDSVKPASADDAGPETVPSDAAPEPVATDKPEDGPADLQALLEAAQAEINALRDEGLRARAEMENVRRRASLDVQKAHKFGLERVMNDLLDVVDGLERGLLAAAAEQVTVEQLKEGNDLTYKMLGNLLERHGVKEVAPDGETFNPEFHEALSMLPTDQAEPNTVVQVIQKGYLLNDRLLRPARVIVAQAPSS